MIITFFGHSDFCANVDIEKKIISIIEEYTQNKSVDFFLGGYGNFDYFAFSCAKKYKEKTNNAKLIFVTPYMEKNYLKQKGNGFDEIIFPDFELVPHKLRIIKRNEYMVDKADLIISYCTDKKIGGTLKTLEYAKRKSKKIVNLA